jgi:hypothetical protein
MSIELNLERIANALELIAAASLRDPSLLPDSAADEAPDVGEAELSYAQKRKAEVAAEPVKTEEKPARRGRPPKVKDTPAPVVETKVEPVVEEDPFAETPVVSAPPEVITKETVRDVMVKLRTKLIADLGDAAGKEKAYSLLRQHGNGATTLPGSTAAGATTAGQLQPEFFASVVTAARAILAA